VVVDETLEDRDDDRAADRVEGRVDDGGCCRFCDADAAGAGVAFTI
jgi:hypothetical protein